MIASVSVSSVERLQKKKENLGIFVRLPIQDMLVTILLKAVVKKKKKAEADMRFQESSNNALRFTAVVFPSFTKVVLTITRYLTGASRSVSKAYQWFDMVLMGSKLNGIWTEPEL